MPVYDLYFDESGNFEDRALLEEGIVRIEPAQKSSQLVGILVPNGAVSIESARKILEFSHNKAGLTLEER